jgi:hypothetical protein
MQNFTPKNKDPATWTPLTTSVELERSARDTVPVPQLVLVMLALALHKCYIGFLPIYKYVNKYRINFYCVIQVWQNDGAMYFVPHHFTIL